MRPQFFAGTDIFGGVSASDASTFKELVEQYISTPVPLALRQASFHALDKKGQSAAKRGLPYLVPAVFRNSPSDRTYEHALHCNLLFLDIDVTKDGACPAAPFVRDPEILSRALGDFSFASYQTVSSTPEKPRMRVMVLADRIPVDRYADAVLTIAQMIGLPIVTPESKTAVQPMFLPVLFSDQIADIEHPYLVGRLEGRPFKVSDIRAGVDSPDAGLAFDDTYQAPSGDDFLAYLRPPVPEITLQVAGEALKAIDADLTYPEWVEVAAALKHQFSHNHAQEAYDLFDTWSSEGVKYDGPESTLAKWKSLKPSPNNRVPITIRSLLHRAVEHGWQAAPVKEACFQSTLAWINDDSRSSVELMSQSLARIAATPLLSYTEEEVLLNATVKQAKKLHKLTMSASTLRKDLKKLKEKATGKDEEAQNVMPAWLKGWCYVARHNEFFRHRTSEKLSPDGFNRTYSRKLLPESEQGDDSESAMAKPVMSPEDYALNVHQIQVVYDYDYRPDEPTKIFTKSEGKFFLNTYRKSHPEANKEGAKAAAAIFEEHLRQLITEPEYRRIVMDWMAYVVQYPGRKIRWAILFQGGEGCGKTFFFEAMKAVLGADHAKLVNKSSVSSQWNEWAVGSQIVAIEEIRVVGANRYDVMNSLKELITNDMVPINQRAKDTRTVRNVTNYILFSNHHDALALAQGDRRYCIIKSKLQLREDIKALGTEYFTRLFDMLVENAGGLRYVLENHQISADFNPNGPAPRTTYLDEVIDDTADEIQSIIKNVVSDDETPLVCAEFISTSVLSAVFTTEGHKQPSPQHLAAVLRGMGYRKMGRFRVAADDEDRHPIWMLASVAQRVTDAGEDVRQSLQNRAELGELF